MTTAKLVYKQCEGQCQRFKMIPEDRTHCKNCWRKQMRAEHREARQRAYDKGFADGFKVARAERSITLESALRRQANILPRPYRQPLDTVVEEAAR